MDSDVEGFLKENFTGVLGFQLDGSVQVAPIHYVVDEDGSLLFKSRRDSDHVKSLERDGRAAMSVYSHASTYDKKAGVQMKGEMLKISSPEEMNRGVTLYSEVFEGAGPKFDPIEVLIKDDAPSTLYRFVIREYKFIDGWSDRFDRAYRSVKDEQKQGVR